MLLPYASDNSPARSNRRPVITLALLVAHLLLSLFLIAADHGFGPWRSQVILDAVGIVPARFQLYTLVSYLFFHAGIGHLVANLFYLWVFGPGVEEALGRARYLFVYVAGGALGGFLQCLVTAALLPSYEAQMPIVGASAACAGLIGLYAARYYRAHLSFVGLPFRPHVVTVVSIYLAAEIGFGIYALVSRDPSDGVAHWAHVGGFTFGLVCAQVLRLPEAGEMAYLGSDAARAIRGGDPGEAIRKWDGLLSREPDNTAARIELARAWLEFGDREQASEHYSLALVARLRRNERGESARLFVEMRQQGMGHMAGPLGSRDDRIRPLALSASQQFALGLALEESESYELAAELFRALTLYSPEAPESEMALLKVAGIYVHRLSRFNEAEVLVQLFLNRYPSSSFRQLAESIRRGTE